MQTDIIARNLTKWRKEQDSKQAKVAVSRASSTGSHMERRSRSVSGPPKFKKLVEYEAANGVKGWMTAPGGVSVEGK